GGRWVETRTIIKSHGLAPHWDCGVLEDCCGIVVAHRYHHVSRDPRLPSHHESSETNLSRLLKDCRWRYLGCGYACGIFGVGRKQPPPCCSMLTRGSLSHSPSTPPRSRQGSGCSAVHSRCLGVRCLSFLKLRSFLVASL